MEDQAIYNAGGAVKIPAQERAIMHLWTHPLFERLLRPLCVPRRGDFTNGVSEIRFSALVAGVLSGGEQAAMSWASAIWTDEVNRDLRDPFDGFGTLDLKLQKVILEAYAIRHDVNREASPWEQ